MQDLQFALELKVRFLPLIPQGDVHDQEQPDDPFTLFNLGCSFHELGQFEKALPHLRRSLELSHPRDSIVRKLYALVAQCHRRPGQEGEALAACRAVGAEPME